MLLQWQCAIRSQLSNHPAHIQRHGSVTDIPESVWTRNVNS